MATGMWSFETIGKKLRLPWLKLQTSASPANTASKPYRNFHALLAHSRKLWPITLSGNRQNRGLTSHLHRGFHFAAVLHMAKLFLFERVYRQSDIFLLPSCFSHACKCWWWASVKEKVGHGMSKCASWVESCCPCNLRRRWRMDN